MDTKGLVTIQDIVDDYFIERDKFSESDILRARRLAERCITSMSIFSLPNVTTTTLEINKDIKTASLPCDFIRCIRLGVKLKNGRIYTLTRDKELGLFEDLSETETQPPTPANALEIRVSYSNYNHDYSGWNYSIKGGLSEYGTYRIDRMNDRIVLNAQNTLNEIVLEYVSSGVKANGTTYIPVYAREAVIAFLKWKDAPIDGRTINQTAVLKQEYYEALGDIDSVTAPSVSEIYDTLLNGYSQLVTR
jgi:hypothetical protein